MSRGGTVPPVSPSVDGTAKVLEQAGLAASAIDSPPADARQFDSESLWAVVAPQIRPGDRVLIVRGASLHSTTDSQGSGREWLSSQLRSLGAQVEWTAEE